MERDLEKEHFNHYVWISTHTLTWSVTKSLTCSAVYSPISTHTLTWSVTASQLAAMAYIYISTHTLTWSVTKVLK